jgi:hypothetical protein
VLFIEIANVQSLSAKGDMATDAAGNAAMPDGEMSSSAEEDSIAPRRHAI